MRTLSVYLLAALPLAAAEPSKEDAEFFESKVRPLLVEKCFSCHSEKKSKGGLALDTLASVLAGGDSGPAVVLKHPEKSKLIEAIGYKNADLQMPPKGKLPDGEIEILTKWVALGAPWPNSKASTKRKPGTITEEDRKWWSFAPMKPAKANATLDGFVTAKLKSSGLTASPEASRPALIRRLTFDLHGLPPTPAEVDAFVNDASPKAYENLVERLLASPRYGERQARLWLDLVRYADSDGYRIDDFRPHAWRYRDYVIKSFNNDKGYDRFVQEQLAGDELFPNDIDALVGTGYLRHWIYEYNNRDAKGQWVTILNDITDTTGDVFLGLGLQCARCHDHKFDPILQKDYYRLQAFFAGLRPRDDLIAATDAQKAEHAAKMKVWEEKTATIRAEIAKIEAPYRMREAESAIKKFPEDVQAMMRKAETERTPYEQQIHELAYRQVDYEYNRIEKNLKGADKERHIALKKELAAFDPIKPPPLPVAFAATDVGPTASEISIPKKGTLVEPGFPTILEEKPAAITPFANSTGRRATLAKWLTQPDNPLAARVMVNRIWQQHFGRGLAANASDFGHLGEPPTHPELLDWLAQDFVKNGWSLKHLHRIIVMSSTYRQSATHPNPGPARLSDPENKLLWKAPVRRLEAEQIRDSLYSLTGELSFKEGGPAVTGGEPRRTVYVKIMRNNRDPLLDVFDAPYWFSSASSRDTTTTPVQSLLLINSPSMLTRGKAFATRLANEEPDEAKRLNLAYRLAFGRAASESEVATAMKFLDEQAKKIDPKKSSSAQASFVGGKIPYRDGQAADLALTSAGFSLSGDKLPAGDFTIEAFIFPRSIADSASVRSIAAHWAGGKESPGWNFGITGKQSRRKPQTVVLQLIGTKRDGSKGEEAVFSDQHIALNKPYYLAAAVKLATEKAAGEIVFYLKDLSNDDEPLLIAKVPHAITGGFDNANPMTLGHRGKSDGHFDGLVDDVRLSNAPLGVEDLLFTREGVNKHTVGYWQFEAKPGVFKDSAGKGLDLKADAVAAPTLRNTRVAAWADLCHVLLNASEFLYVE